jgi:hypothetical protein
MSRDIKLIGEMYDEVLTPKSETPISDAAEIISMHPNDLLGWPNGRRTRNVPKAKMQELERKLAAVSEQRDKLAEELKEAQDTIGLMLKDSSCSTIPRYTKENLIIQTGEEH